MAFPALFGGFIVRKLGYWHYMQSQSLHILDDHLLPAMQGLGTNGVPDFTPIMHLNLTLCRGGHYCPLPNHCLLAGNCRLALSLEDFSLDHKGAEQEQYDQGQGHLPRYNEEQNQRQQQQQQKQMIVHIEPSPALHQISVSSQYLGVRAGLAPAQAGNRKGLPLLFEKIQISPE
jgi:hypothetical protein